MATWQLGPFDNDDAVEWCGTLEDSTPTQRLDVVRRTLEAAVSAGPALSPESAAQAIAAAALVLQSLTGRPSSDSAYTPNFSLGSGSDDVQAAPSLRVLATQALDTVLAERSMWRLRWADNIEEEDALAIIEDLRTSLAAEVP